MVMPGGLPQCRDHRRTANRAIMNKPAVGETRVADDRFRIRRTDCRRQHTDDPASPVVQQQRSVGEAVTVIGQEPPGVQECAIARSATRSSQSSAWLAVKSQTVSAAGSAGTPLPPTSGSARTSWSSLLPVRPFTETRTFFVSTGSPLKIDSVIPSDISLIGIPSHFESGWHRPKLLYLALHAPL